MTDIQVSKAIGLFSIGLGTAQVLFGRRMNRALGLGQTPGLVRLIGLRELATGTMVLTFPDKSAPMWTRVAGDVLDLALLAAALAPGNRRREATLLALLAVLGVTALDVATAGSLTHRHGRALETARRTRVKRA